MKRITVEAHRSGAVNALRDAESKLPALTKLTLAEELAAKRDEDVREARRHNVAVRVTAPNPNRPLFSPFAGLNLRA